MRSAEEGKPASPGHDPPTRGQSALVRRGVGEADNCPAHQSENVPGSGALCKGTRRASACRGRVVAGQASLPFYGL